MKRIHDHPMVELAALGLIEAVFVGLFIFILVLLIGSVILP